MWLDPAPGTNDVVGLRSGHGGDEFDMLFAGDDFVLQLHRHEAEEHRIPHGAPGGDSGGITLWFEAEDRTVSTLIAQARRPRRPSPGSRNGIRRRITTRRPSGIRMATSWCSTARSSRAERAGAARTVQNEPVHSGSQAYDRIGVGYAALRRPDPRLAEMMHQAIGDAETIVNVGAGAGSYEPRDSAVVSVEPSSVDAGPASGDLGGSRPMAEHLPFGDAAFDVAMAVMTVHHWNDLDRGSPSSVGSAAVRSSSPGIPNIGPDCGSWRTTFPPSVPWKAPASRTCRISCPPWTRIPYRPSRYRTTSRTASRRHFGADPRCTSTRLSAPPVRPSPLFPLTPGGAGAGTTA